MAFSPKEEILASGLDDGTVLLWRITNNALLCTLKEHTRLVGSVAFSPDGNTLASGSWDRTVRLWQKTGKTFCSLCVLKARSAVTSVAFLHEGHQLAAGLKDGTIWLYQISACTLQDRGKGKVCST
jgi:WD40 repeat protein